MGPANWAMNDGDVDDNAADAHDVSLKGGWLLWTGLGPRTFRERERERVRARGKAARATNALDELLSSGRAQRCPCIMNNCTPKTKLYARPPHADVTAWSLHSHGSSQCWSFYGTVLVLQLLRRLALACSLLTLVDRVTRQDAWRYNNVSVHHNKTQVSRTRGLFVRESAVDAFVQ